MKILFLDSPAFAKEDLLEAFTECGIEYTLFFHEAYHQRSDAGYEQAFDTAVSKETFDFVFSFNYFPILSNCCRRHCLKYVSYVYDSPLVSLYSYTLINDCNYVFLFDKTLYLKFKNAGIDTVYYLPLAANARRLSSLSAPAELADKLRSEVSFVGSLYNEEHNLFDQLKNLPDYTRGYLDAIMTAQQKLYGCFLLEDLLYSDILKDLQNSIPYQPMSDGTEPEAYVYANYFLARKITSKERISLLNRLSMQFQVKLFSHKPSPLIPKAEFMGTADYYTLMPLIFQNSDINLNITLKSIYSGIPLRCMDIMGAGGFLLTNYQADFFDFFLPEEDFVFYESEEDCLKKTRHYLSHDSKRRQIAENAFGKIMDHHTFSHRVQTMLSVLS